MLYKKTAGRQSGFGLVEIVIAIAVLGIMSAGLTAIFRSIQYAQTAAEYQKSATLAAQREIESLRTNNYNTLTAGTNIDFSSSLPADLPKPRTGSVAITEPVSGLKRVDVTVTYRYSGKTRTISVSSTIGVIGITK